LLLLPTAEAENNNGSPADMFLQLYLIFILKTRQLLIDDAAGHDTHCQLIALLSSILYCF